MGIIGQLSNDWQGDLKALARLDSRDVREKIETTRRAHGRAYRLRKKIAWPEFLEDIWNETQGRNLDPALHIAEQYSGRFRRDNVELLHRASTVMAVSLLQTELTRKAKYDASAAGQLIWVEALKKEWLQELGSISHCSPSLSCESDSEDSTLPFRLFEKLRLRPPVLNERILIDPDTIAEAIYDQREKACIILASRLKKSQSSIMNIHREKLERTALS